MNRTLAALIAGSLSFLVLVGIHSEVASAAEADAAMTELDDGLLRWLLRSRWWRQVPEQPALPMLSDITHDSVTVSWTAPESAVFEIADYDVQYRAAGASGYLDWAHDGTATQATITDLAEVTEYQVRVRAGSEVGEGDWSAAASGTTLLAPPRFVEGERAEREVEENTAPGEAIGAPVTATVREGSVHYGLEGADADAFAIDASSGQLSTRQDVDYNHEARSSYAVEVTATHTGAGTARITVRILVLDVNEPPGKPVPPVLSALRSAAFRVTWDAPGNTGPEISGYDVEYREDGTADYLDADHEGTETQTTIEGLTRETVYEVRVRAVNDEGVGGWSDAVQGRTPGSGGGNPPPPSRPTPPPPPSKSPDLVVESASIDDPDLDGDESFTLSATVRNRGDVASAATMLRYYRSSNAIISTTDTQIGASSVGDLAADGVSNESIGLTAPSDAGTYHYGACVDSVPGESITGNNCSAAVELTVKSQGPPTAPPDRSAFDSLFFGNFLSTPDNVFIFFGAGGRFLESNEHLGNYTYANTGPNTGTVTQTYDNGATFGGSCTLRLTFVSKTTGTLGYTCDDGQNGTQDWRLDVIDTGSFNIEVIWDTARSSAVDSAFRTAAARWESVISGNLSQIYLSGSQTADFGVIDDLRIYARVETIDGVFGTLGSAGPRFVRTSSGLPVVSRVRLDEDDVSRLSTSDLNNLVEHEMAHALGFGATIWSNLGFLKNPSPGGTPDPLPDTHFDGANAIAAFDAAGGTGYTGNKVPVENVGGSGAVNWHWRASVFGGELMVATFVFGLQYPMSAITVQSMADLGYTVNVGAADGYALPTSSAPTTPAFARTATLNDKIPLQCIVLQPDPTEEVTLIELKSYGDL